MVENTEMIYIPSLGTGNIDRVYQRANKGIRNNNAKSCALKNMKTKRFDNQQLSQASGLFLVFPRSLNGSRLGFTSTTDFSQAS